MPAPPAAGPAEAGSYAHRLAAQFNPLVFASHVAVELSRIYLCPFLGVPPEGVVVSGAVVLDFPFAYEALDNFQFALVVPLGSAVAPQAQTIW